MASSPFVSPIFVTYFDTYLAAFDRLWIILMSTILLPFEAISHALLMSACRQYEPSITTCTCGCHCPVFLLWVISQTATPPLTFDFQALVLLRRRYES